MMESIFIEFRIMVLDNDLVSKCVKMCSCLDKIEDLEERNLWYIRISLEEIRA